MLNSQSILLIFAIFATKNVINAAKYEPLYVIEGFLGYHSEFELTYDDETQSYLIQAPNTEIFSFCPRRQDKYSLESYGALQSFVQLDTICYESPGSVVLEMKDPKHHGAGFLIYNPDKKSLYYDNLYKNIPQDHHPVVIFSIIYDETIALVRYVKYSISYGNYLKSKPERGDIIPYDKNIDILRFDLDPLYSQFPALIKVPLAPPDDFFFETWKSATYHNIQTAPMWRDLLPQWTSLEIFVRRVTQVLRELSVRTGVKGVTTLPGHSKPLYLADDKHPVPKYFLKVLLYQYFYKYTWRHYGILFVMHNDRSPTDDSKLCTGDIASKNGWNFLQKDQRLVSSMYACPVNEKVMSLFDDKLDHAAIYRDLNLNRLPILSMDINVLEEMEKFEKKRIK